MAGETRRRNGYKDCIRKVLGFCLAICREAAVRPLKPNTFGVGRM